MEIKDKGDRFEHHETPNTTLKDYIHTNGNFNAASPKDLYGNILNIQDE